MTKSSAGIRRPRHRLCQLSVRRARFLPAPNCPQPPQAQFTASHGRHHHQPRLPDCLSPSPRGHCRASRTLQAGDHLRSPQAPQPNCCGPAGGTWPGPPRWSEAGRPPPSQPSPATPAPADTAQPLALPSRLHSRHRRTASTHNCAVAPPPSTAGTRSAAAPGAAASRPSQAPIPRHVVAPAPWEQPPPADPAAGTPDLRPPAPDPASLAGAGASCAPSFGRRNAKWKRGALPPPSLRAARTSAGLLRRRCDEQEGGRREGWRLRRQARPGRPRGSDVGGGVGWKTRRP